MPVTNSAKKALRRDRRRDKINTTIRTKMRNLLVRAKEEPTPKNLSAAVSAIDRAAKKHMIHRNKAARLKSRLMRTVQNER